MTEKQNQTKPKNSENTKAYFDGMFKWANTAQTLQMSKFKCKH